MGAVRRSGPWPWTLACTRVTLVCPLPVSADSA